MDIRALLGTTKIWAPEGSSLLFFAHSVDPDHPHKLPKHVQFELFGTAKKSVPQHSTPRPKTCEKRMAWKTVAHLTVQNPFRESNLSFWRTFLRVAHLTVLRCTEARSWVDLEQQGLVSYCTGSSSEGLSGRP